MPLYAANNPMVHDQSGIEAVSPRSEHSSFTPFPAAVGLIFTAPCSLSAHAGRKPPPVP